MRVVMKMTLYETCFHRKLNGSHLKIFGCIVYVLINTNESSKIDTKIEKYNFIDFSDESKGYHLYNLEMKKLLICGDVIFL